MFATPPRRTQSSVRQPSLTSPFDEASTPEDADLSARLADEEGKQALLQKLVDMMEKNKALEAKVKSLQSSPDPVAASPQTGPKSRFLPVSLDAPIPFARLTPDAAPLDRCLPVTLDAPIPFASLVPDAAPLDRYRPVTLDAPIPFASLATDVPPPDRFPEAPDPSAYLPSFFSERDACDDYMLEPPPDLFGSAGSLFGSAGGQLDPSHEVIDLVNDDFLDRELQRRLQEVLANALD